MKIKITKIILIEIIYIIKKLINIKIMIGHQEPSVEVHRNQDTQTNLNQRKAKNHLQIKIKTIISILLS